MTMMESGAKLATKALFAPHVFSDQSTMIGNQISGHSRERKLCFLSISSFCLVHGHLPFLRPYLSSPFKNLSKDSVKALFNENAAETSKTIPKTDGVVLDELRIQAAIPGAWYASFRGRLATYTNTKSL